MASKVTMRLPPFKSLCCRVPWRPGSPILRYSSCIGVFYRHDCWLEVSKSKKYTFDHTWNNRIQSDLNPIWSKKNGLRKIDDFLSAQKSHHDDRRFPATSHVLGWKVHTSTCKFEKTNEPKNTCETSKPQYVSPWYPRERSVFMCFLFKLTSRSPLQELGADGCQCTFRRLDPIGWKQWKFRRFFFVCCIAA